MENIAKGLIERMKSVNNESHKSSKIVAFNFWKRKYEIAIDEGRGVDAENYLEEMTKMETMLRADTGKGHNEKKIEGYDKVREQ